MVMARGLFVLYLLACVAFCYCMARGLFVIFHWPALHLNGRVNYYGMALDGLRLLLWHGP